jgi:hypothetical protein
MGDSKATIISAPDDVGNRWADRCPGLLNLACAIEMKITSQTTRKIVSPTYFLCVTPNKPIVNDLYPVITAQ